MRHYFRFILCSAVFLFWSIANASNPQKSVICDALLRSAESVVSPIFLDAQTILEIPIEVKKAIGSELLSEINSDIQEHAPNDKSFMFVFESEAQIAQFLAALPEQINSTESDAQNMLFFRHITSITMPLWPLRTWAKQIMGGSFDRKELAFTGGWMGLATMVAGFGVIATQNPVFNFDRYVRLALKSDKQIISETERLAAAIAEGKEATFHISKSYVLNNYYWQGMSLRGNTFEKLNISVAAQVDADTRPLLQSFFKLLTSKIFYRESLPPLQVKMDLIADTSNRKMVLLVRTKEQ